MKPTALLLLVAAGLAGLTGCGAPAHYVTPVVAPVAIAQPQADAICVNAAGIRVDDSWCPIGDGILNAGYGWDYALVGRSAVDIPYVGYPVPVGPLWTRTRPIQVTTINIQRGVFPANPSPGSTATATRVPPVSPGPAAASSTSTVTRGGLGSTSTGTAVVATTVQRAVPAASLAPTTRPFAPPTGKVGRR